MHHKERIAIIVAAAILAPMAVSVGPASQAHAADQALPTIDFLAARADQYLEQRARAVTVDGARAFAISTVAATDAMTQRLNAEYQQLSRLGVEYQKIDGGYSRAEVTITPNGSVSSDGTTAQFSFVEETKLYHALTAEEIAEGAPEAEEYSLRHTLRFTREADGVWRLAGDSYAAGSMPPSTYMADPELDLEIPEEDSGAPDSPEGDKIEGSEPIVTARATRNSSKESQATASYDYSKMAAYANKHWKSYNGDWRRYDNDCTNFISQAMWAGGWKATSGSISSRKDNKKWFYGSTKLGTSYTWAGAENWYWFASKHSKRTRILGYVGDMGLADVLQADFDRNGNINHTMIVTKSTSSNKYLTYHTPSVHNRSLKKILAKYPKALWYAHRT
ncbi:amidase domain-containing protein [Streptomyces sp. NPDC085942]|uniref:amidase domain-containing protein n=1 Tax=Streptomyces sp. NPDC085942 TaxID=3365743 RepID=UPI0037D351DC